jgi:hypothetical protein
VRDSNGTILFFLDPALSGGSMKTVGFALKHNKPCLHIHSVMSDAPQRLRTFLDDNIIKVLNVAGPRACKKHKVTQFVVATLDLVFNLSSNLAVSKSG